MSKWRPAGPFGALVGLALVSACSEARSDIENIDAAELEMEATALSEAARNATEEQVAKIQTFNVPAQPDVTSEGEISVKDQ